MCPCRFLRFYRAGESALVEHNIDAITVTMFLREIVDAGGHASVWNRPAHCLSLCGHGQQTYLTRVAVLAHAKIRPRSMSGSEKGHVL